jgi:RHS repeat-associated protein
MNGGNNNGTIKIHYTGTGHGTSVHVTLDNAGNSNVINISAIKVPHYTSVPQSVVSRVCNGESYRYGFNGQMKVNEWAGLGNHLDFKFRGYDSRVGRFSAVDPLFKKYPWNSNYAFAENRVIDGIDLEGREWSSAQDGNTVTLNVKIQVVSDAQLIDDCNMQTYLDAYKSKAEAIFSGQKDGIQYNLNIEFVKTEAPFKLVFSEERVGQKSPVDGVVGITKIGNTQKNTIYINTGVNFGNGFVSPTGCTMNMDYSAETFAGELGHTGGLLHPETTTCPEQIPEIAEKYKTSGNNLMRHEKNKTNLESSQMKHIDNKVKEQQANPDNAKAIECTE